jgi:hypothetical protein
MLSPHKLLSLFSRLFSGKDNVATREEPRSWGDMTASRRTKSSGLSGFVSFMKRRDVEDALREYDGYHWGGCVLRVGWSKAVPVAEKLLYGELFSTCFRHTHIMGL